MNWYGMSGMRWWNHYRKRMWVDRRRKRESRNYSDTLSIVQVVIDRADADRNDRITNRSLHAKFALITELAGS